MISASLPRAALALLLSSASLLAAAPNLGNVKAPAGFKVSLFASPPDIGYPTCLAVAPSGELFVGIDENGSLDAKEKRGRVTRCADRDGDGKADEFRVFAEMDSPRGLWFDNGSLYVMHPPLLTVFTDDDGDGVSDRSEVLVKGLGFDLKFRGADHTVNGMRMGIDGWLYIAVGDYGAIKAEGKDGSTFQMHGGGVARVRPDGSGLEIVSRGQRNIYDVAVSPELDLFTRDNTNDGDGWDVRLSHVISSGQYGYPSLYKNFSDEIVPPLADYGGGSPCGSLYLDEPGFPDGLGRALYTCEWGRSKVYRHPLEPNGASFKAGQAEFLEIPRPTDMEADAFSRLYVASWSNGSFTYSGPDVGFVVQLVPENAAAPAFPELKGAAMEVLLEQLQSPGATRRLFAQREILRRSPQPEVMQSLEKIARSEAPLSIRVAALLTASQLAKIEARPLLLELARTEALREFALRALADDLRSASSLPLEPFLAALKDSGPRVRLQAVIALGRMAKPEAAREILPLAAEPDGMVSHAAIQTLIALKAADASFAVFDSPGSKDLWPAAARVLQALHEPRVVEGLARRLEKTSDPAARQLYLKALSRLATREADWDGRWWGTRPDTTGPYFKTADWSETERIREILQRALASLDKEALPSFVMELHKTKNDLPGLIPLTLQIAESDAKFRVPAVEVFSARPRLAEETIPFLSKVSLSAGDKPALRATALRALTRSPAPEAFDAAVAALAKIGGEASPPPELAGVWNDFTKDSRQLSRVERFTKLAASPNAGERLLAWAALLNMPGQRGGSAEAKNEASKAIDEGWSKPESAAVLLDAIGRTRNQAYAWQVRELLKDARPEVKAAAARAADLLELNKESGGGNRIEKLSYEQAAAAAQQEKGDRRAGARIFVAAGCAACHTTASSEAPKGPFLGGIAARYSRAELCESILKPGAKIAQGFETQWFKLGEEDELEGFVTREAGDDLDVRNTAGITATLAKKDIRERGKRETSMMPTGLLDSFSPADLASLLAYLESLKGD